MLILGGGFAGVYCARQLARELGRESAKDVGLIADQNIMVFQPMLAEVAGAELSPLDVVSPLREFCRHTNVLCGKVTHIDLAARRVTLDGGHFTENVEIEFEHLVITLGSVIDLSHVPGMPEHAFIMKGVGDALNLRAAVIRRLEQANISDDAEIKTRLLAFTVVGGGYSGVETAGQLLDLIQDVQPLYKNLAGISAKVRLIHNGPFLLAEIGENLGRYAERKLRERGLEIILNARVTAITASKVNLEDGRSFESHTVVSTIGNAPHPLLLKFCAENKIEMVKGRIATEPTMRVKGQEHIWAAGDCAAVPMDGQPSCPPTAQFALRQGNQLAANLASALKGKPLKPFYFKNLGQLAAIGHHTAVAEVMGFRFSGFFAWWFWRSVYLWKLPRLQRKIQVVVNWTLALFFRRDVSLIATRPSEVLPEMHLEKGDYLYHAGEPAFSFYIVKSGGIELWDGERLVKTVRQGGHFGEWALLHGQHWLFTARAVEPTTLVTVDKKVFQALAGTSSDIGNLLNESAKQYAPENFGKPPQRETAPVA